MSEHEKYAKQLPGNQTPDVGQVPLPQNHAERMREFLKRLAQVRGKYGRDQIRHIELKGWPSFGADVDNLDAMGQPRIEVLERDD